ncbi:MAG TPA: XRE family transcriptional regulator [Acetobacteraceae bacterium]|nr:XRE family transcriptional regulator [Acetobacteraceae bacterium]
MPADPIEIELSRRGTPEGVRDRDTNLTLAKARLGARIVRILDEAGLSIRQAEVRTGVSHIEFSRIRQAKLRRFTIDRLMSILECLGQDVEVSVTVHPRSMPATNGS